MLRRYTPAGQRAIEAPKPISLSDTRQRLYNICQKIKLQPEVWRRLAHEDPHHVKNICQELIAMAYLLSQHEGKLDEQSRHMFFDARGFEDTASLLKLYLAEQRDEVAAATAH